MNLCVMILTSNVFELDIPPKIMPKVCFSINGKSMIEICIENALKLNPKKIILAVMRSHIIPINRLLKYKNYSKLISYHLVEEDRNLSSVCCKGKDVLVIPGNAPLFSTDDMFKIISSRRNLKISNNLFFIKRDSLHLLNNTSDLDVEDLVEVQEVETRQDLEEISKLIKKNRNI